LFPRVAAEDDPDAMPSTPAERAEFGRHLKRLRGRRSLAELSKMLLLDCGLDASVAKLSGWERGEYAPKHREVVEVLDTALGGRGILLSTLGYTDEPTLTIDEREARFNEIDRRFDRLEAALAELAAEIRSGPAPAPRAGRRGPR
jgi:uncharacterized protein YjiS (DUF1127 family)